MKEKPRSTAIPTAKRLWISENEEIRSKSKLIFLSKNRSLIILSLCLDCFLHSIITTCVCCRCEWPKLSHHMWVIRSEIFNLFSIIFGKALRISGWNQSSLQVQRTWRLLCCMMIISLTAISMNNNHHRRMCRGKRMTKIFIVLKLSWVNGKWNSKWQLRNCLTGTYCHC